MSAVDASDARVFRLTTVNETEAPEGATGGSWYVYVIENELTSIRGYASGSKKHVVARATAYLEQLNERNGPVPSTWPAARKRTRRA
jgi:hypothetical protein